jgi:membrane protease subunit HflC
MGSRVLGILVVVLALILLVTSSTFLVGEQELAVRVRLSQIKGANFTPGLQFKIPFIDRVVKFDRRVLTRKFDGEQFLTSESQGLTIDYYIKWRIIDAETFYQATSGGDEGRAESLVGDTIQDGIKNAVAGRTLRDIVISDRQQVTGEFMKDASAKLLRLGIELVDVRVQRIDLQEEVASSVYDSMKRTFEGIAQTQRGEGSREAQIVRSEAERKRTELIAESLANAQRIRGEGDAIAAATYAGAYNRNPEFYSFYRSLQAYRSALGRDGDVMVISPDSEFFRYFKSPAPTRR